MDVTQANEHGRVSLREGMSGWDAQVVQIAINGMGPLTKLLEDGDFGAKTAREARRIQLSLGITPDAIVGPQTMAAICVAKCKVIEKNRLPGGLLKGLCFGESGGIITAVSPAYDDGSRDYGDFQEHLLRPDLPVAKDAFSPGESALAAAGEVMGAFQTVHGKPGAITAEAAWKLAVLNHNWPWAVLHQDAQGHNHGLAMNEHDFSYTETGTGIVRKMSDPAPWVQQYRVRDVNSALEWCAFYVASKIVYVKSWEVAR